MVKVILGTDIWRVFFRHHVDANPNKRFTDCWVTYSRVGHEREPLVVCKGRAKCHKGDSWDRAEGRLKSMQHTLDVRRDDTRAQVKLASVLDVPPLSRPVRTALWGAYWQTISRPSPAPQKDMAQAKPEIVAPPARKRTAKKAVSA